MDECIRSDRLPADEHEIVLHNDGTWDPLPPRKDECTVLAPTISKSQVKYRGEERESTCMKIVFWFVSSSCKYILLALKLIFLLLLLTINLQIKYNDL